MLINDRKWKYISVFSKINSAWKGLTLYVLNFSEERLTYIYILCHYSTLIKHRYLKSFLKQDEYLHILHSQYHYCWCPGDLRSQGISSHDIDQDKPRLLGPGTLRVNITARHGDGQDCWNWPWRTRKVCLSYTINIRSADVLAMQGARASAEMVSI